MATLLPAEMAAAAPIKAGEPLPVRRRRPHDGGVPGHRMQPGVPLREGNGVASRAHAARGTEGTGRWPLSLSCSVVGMAARPRHRS